MRQPMINEMIASASALLHRLKSRKGQSLVEYALILTFISVLCIAVLTVLGAQIRGVYSIIISALTAARAAI
jgi:Flp pilus assembly pilin Flp